MRRLVILLALALPATAAAVIPTTVLPKPKFPAPANSAGTNDVTFKVLSSTPIDPARLLPSSKPIGVKIDGEDGTTQHYVLGRNYTFDFRNYAWPPRVAPGEMEFAYEQVVWARQTDFGLLFVETAHNTYAKSTYGLNGYLSAVDIKSRRLLWRSPAQVANARNFVMLNRTLISGYGFTAEPDYLYAIDSRTGKVRGRLLLPNAAQTIARHLHNMLTVTTYDHRLVIRVLNG